MHPNTKPTVVVLILCMVILAILLLPLPYTTYKVLRFFLSLLLFYPAGFFLRPCKNLMFTPSEDRIEIGTRDPLAGTFSGKLQDTHARRDVAELTKENSQLLRYVEQGNAITRPNPLPAISWQLTQGLVVAAVIMNPIPQIHLPRTAWMFLEILVIAILGWALHLLREENEGRRPHVSVTGTIGQPPTVDFLSVFEVFRRACRLWPAVVGGAFAIGLLGSKVGDGDFENFSLWHAANRTVSSLLIAALCAWLVYCFLDVVALSDPKNTGVQVQAPGEIFILVFVLIYLCLAFGGYFTPVPPFDDPDGYDWGDDG